MDALLVVVGVAAAAGAVGLAAAATAAIRLWSGVAIARMALSDAPEPHWSAIRDTLAETRLVSPRALRIACKRYPPVAE